MPKVCALAVILLIHLGSTVDTPGSLRGRACSSHEPGRTWVYVGRMYVCAQTQPPERQTVGPQQQKTQMRFFLSFPAGHAAVNEHKLANAAPAAAPAAWVHPAGRAPLAAYGRALQQEEEEGARAAQAKGGGSGHGPQGAQRQQ
eukprot:1194991-Prymnesium_polylepis.1